MPCNTITTTQLDLSKANTEVLEMTLKDLGFEIYSKSSERISARNSQTGARVIWKRNEGTTIEEYNKSDLSEKITKGYSFAAIQYAAKKNGWVTKKTSDNQIQVIKR